MDNQLEEARKMQTVCTEISKEQIVLILAFL